MPHSEIIEKYLTRVILFKEKQNVFSDFCDENKRFFLLRSLFRDLGFEDDLWNVRSDFAKQTFKTYKLLSSDFDLRSVAPKTFHVLIEKYIRRAIALDPYNVEFLQAFFQGSVARKNSDKNLAIHYISLYHPNSSEFQNLLVDLNLKPNDISFDYLSETVTVPFINEMVSLKQKSALEETELKSDKKLKEIAVEAGLDSKMLDAIKDSVPDMVTTVEKTLVNHWLDWSESYKAILAMEKALDLAPYDKEVLITGFSFYSSFYWRLMLGHKGIKSTVGKDQCFEYVFGSKKPKKEEIYVKVHELFFKSLELKDRLTLVLQKELKETPPKNDENDVSYDSIRAMFTPHFRIRNRSWSDYKEPDLVSIDAFFDKEVLTFQILTEHFKSKKYDWKIILISVAIMTPLCYLFSWKVFGSFFPFPAFFLPVFIVPALIIYIREKSWKNRDLEITEVLPEGKVEY